MITGVASRWVIALPRRWARNAGIFVAIFAVASYGSQTALEKLIDDPALSHWIKLPIPVTIAVSSAIGFAFGAWARWSLSPLHGPDWTAKVEAIPRKWALGGASLGILKLTADDVLALLEPKFVTGPITNAASKDFYLIATLGGTALVGLIVGLISRRSLNKALAADQRQDGASLPPPQTPEYLSGTTAPVAVTTVQERRSSNFIARNWRGDFPLWVSYWVFGLFGNIACVLVAVAIGAAFSSEDGYNPYAFLATFVLVWLGVGLILLWQSVGIWRSANRYAAVKTRQGKRAPWAGLAKLAVILGALRIIAEFVSSGAPQITEASKVAFFDDPDLPPYAVRIMRDGTEVEVSGGFKYGLHEDLLRILKAAPRVQVVHLNSLGGRTGEAEKLYRSIRNRGLVTYTASQCMSACTIAFAGGRERWIQAGAELGFHAPSYPGSSERDLAQAARAHEALLVAAGFDPTFARRALSTPNKDIWTPTVDELLQAHAITGVADSHRFAASGYGSDVTRDDMAGKMKRFSPTLGALGQRSPKDFDQIADAYYAGYLAGESAGKLNEAANSKLIAVIQSYRPWADDQTLADLGRLIIDQLGALATRDARLCYEYASGAGGAKNFSVYLPEDLIQREAAINDRILRTAARRPNIPEPTLESYWGTVDAGLARRFGPDAVQWLLSASAQPAQYGSYCNMAIGMYQEMLKLGDPQAAALMRQIFKGM